MDVNVFRYLMAGIVAGSLTAHSFWAPRPPSLNPDRPSIVHSGCYPIGYWCGTREQAEEFVVTGSTPTSKDECIKLCEAQLTSKYEVVGGDAAEGGNSYGTGYKANSVKNCEANDAGDGKTRIKCEYTYQKVCEAAGRLPAGISMDQGSATIEHVGDYFARMAYLEEAAVTAFAYLARELEAYDAPERLVNMAKEAIQEEVEHAEMVRALCERYGATAPKVEVEPFQLRSLHEIALDNISEGCVRETYGALQATYQSEHAEDPAVRAVTHRIVFEESRHAMLSWEIAEWLHPQLTQEQQDDCRAAIMQTIEELEDAVAQEPPPSLAKVAGLPPAVEAQRMFQTLKETLWA